MITSVGTKRDQSSHQTPFNSNPVLVERATKYNCDQDATSCCGAGMNRVGVLKHDCVRQMCGGQVRNEAFSCQDQVLETLESRSVAKVHDVSVTALLSSIMMMQSYVKIIWAMKQDNDRLDFEHWVNSNRHTQTRSYDNSESSLHVMSQISTHQVVQVPI